MTGSVAWFVPASLEAPRTALAVLPQTLRSYLSLGVFAVDISVYPGNQEEGRTAHILIN